MRLLLLLIFFGSWSSSKLWSQTRQELEKKRQSVSRAMSKTSQQLESTKRNKKRTLHKLQALHRNIKLKTALIDSIAQHRGTLDSLKIRQELVTKALKEDLQILYQRHQLLVRYYYKQQFQTNYHSTSKQLKQQKYTRHALAKRHYQIALVSKVQQSLTQQTNFLCEQKAQKDSLLSQAQRLQEQLNKEELQRTRKVTKLKRQERELRQRLASQKKSKRLLSKKIEQAILEQIAVAKAAARRYQQKKKQHNKIKHPNVPLLPNKETHAFAQQKGRLIWPIYQGKIIGYYGQQAHPLFKDVLLNNNGIDLQGQYNSVVRNVYKGTVVSVFTIPGYHNAVMVKHGEYYTTYSNIAKVYVKKGQFLKTGGQIGTIGRNPKGKGHLLHFELWHNKNKENPIHWISSSSSGRL